MDNDMILYLKSKYNYEDYLLQILDKLYPAFIEVFGKEHEQEIKNAFLNTEIIVFNEQNEFEKVNDKFKIPHSNYLTILEGGQLYTLYNSLYDPKRFIRVRNDGINKEKIQFVGTIAHELVHAILSRKNPIVKKEKNKKDIKITVTEKTGIDYRTYLFSNKRDENGYFTRIKKIDEALSNAEEGFTEINAIDIIKNAYNKNLIPSEKYGKYVSYINTLLVNNEIKKYFNELRFQHFNKWYEITPENPTAVFDYFHHLDLYGKKLEKKYGIIPPGYNHILTSHEIYAEYKSPYIIESLLKKTRTKLK